MEKLSKEFVEKYNKVITNLKAPKNQVNKFGGFNYRSCEDIQEGVKKCLTELNLTDCASYVSDEIVLVGNRFYVKATAVFTDGENYIEAYGYAREPESRTKMDDAQVTGSSSSYARKYALNGLYSIDDTKFVPTPELDAQDNSKKPSRVSGGFDFKTAIKNCQTKAELVELWNGHPELQTNQEFSAAMSARKTEIK